MKVFLNERKRLRFRWYHCILIAALLLINMLLTNYVFADGSKQFKPDSTVNSGIMILNNEATYGTFAGYSASDTNRLYIHISDATNEKIYFGLGGRSTAVNYYFRVKDPSGNIVYGPTLLPTATGVGYIDYYKEAILGPQPINAAGYNPFVITPTVGVTGDYYIEFNKTSGTVIDNSTDLTCQIFDVTVGNTVSNTAMAGRVFSKNWSFNTAGYGNPFKGSFYIYGVDSSVTKVDLNGIKPYKFRISSNEWGCVNSSNPVSDRQSIAGPHTLPELKLFLLDPDNTVFPSGTTAFLNSTPTLSRCVKDIVYIHLDLFRESDVTIFIDGNNDNLYTNVAPDRKLYFPKLPLGLNTVTWDGKDGSGSYITALDTMKLMLRIENGEVDLPIFDVENHENGYNLSVIRPNASLFVDSLFYDDTQIGGGSEFIGCGFPCHTWSSTPPNTNLATIGENTTINTYWFAHRFNYFNNLVVPDYLISDAGPNQNYCASIIDTVPLNGSIAFSLSAYTGSFHWTTSGTGSFFPNDSTYNAKYLASAADIASGSVKLYIAPRYTCTDPIDSMTLTLRNGLVVTYTQTNVNCFGDATGSVDITVAGGTSTFSYLWSNGATTQDISAITDGTYTVTVSDANACSASKVIIITEPASALGANAGKITDVSCFGGSNGELDLTAFGGTSPYTYLWNNGATTEDISGLIVGTYTVTVTDANGCTTTASNSILQPFAALTTGTTQVNVLCFGNSTGSVDLTVNGGTTAYSFLWSNAETTEDISSLAAGTYTVTVTDANGCTISTNATITQPAATLSTGTSQVNVLCFGNSTGSIDLTVNGGTIAYSYVWSNAETTEDISSLAAGTYTVTVTDANGCTISTNASIIQPAAALSTGTTQVNVLCFGNSTGSIDLTVNGGTIAYSYVWSNAETTEDISSLASGTYTVTVTDANGCTISTNATITQPAAALSTGTSQVNVLCFGNSTGSVDLTVNGGTTAYSFLWSNAETTEDISSLAAGTYTVTVTDANGCTISTNATITQPAATLSTGTSQVNVLCFGNSTGSIDLTVNGGTIAYSYVWSNAETTEDISSLAAGTYTVTVTDANGCTISTNATITQPAAALSTGTTQVNVLCFGNSTGSIDLTVNGGTIAYSYVWSNAETTEDISSLASGTYTVTVTDVNGCTISTNATITQPGAALSTGTTQVNVLCFGNSTGSVDLTVNGGTTAYSFLWSNAETTEDISSLAAGTYTVTVTDANGCTISTNATITQPAATLSTGTSQVNVLCFGNSTGSIDLTANGGTIAYSYVWSNAETTEDISSLAAGTYTVTVTDANGCTISTNATITQPAAALSTGTTQVNVLCFGNSTGSIDLTVNGGTIAYSYVWSNAETTEDISSLASGTYTVTVTDVNGCTISTNATITQPGAALSTGTTQVNVLCFGNSTGSVDLTVNGGTTAYSFLWSNAETTEDISSLAAGTYTVTVTDANGCTISDAATITEPASALGGNATKLTDVSCFGGTNGALDLTAFGGTPGYTFLWSNGATTEDISNLPAGTYTVTITDANGCTESTSNSISEPAAALSTNTTQVDVLCFGNATGSIDLTANGGTPVYTYLWSTAETTEDISGLASGTYTVTVTDANGCTTSVSITIFQPVAALSAGTTQVDVLCFGNSSGSIDLTVNDGTPGYSYLWSNTATTEDISSLAAGTYTVTVTDANGCTLSANTVITQPAAALSAGTTQVDVLCFGNSTGSIDLTVMDGTPGYSYLWSNTATTEDISSLAAGTYTVTITDANGCTLSTNATITQPFAGLSSGTTQVDVLCYGDSTGSIDLTVNGGTPAYFYVWSNSSTIEDITWLLAGTYTVTVTDAGGCTLSTAVTITQPAAPLAGSTLQVDVLCYGNSTGSIDLTVNGGTPAYSFTWSNAATTEDISLLTAGTYTVTISDGNGCTTSLSATIMEPADSLSTTINKITNVACYGDSTGDIDLVVFGGTAPYTYLWNTGATTEDLSLLPAGTYIYTVTDSHGCSLTDSTIVTQPSAALSGGILPTDVLCYGDSSGVLDLTPTGGTVPYVFIWSNGATSEDINLLAAGTYTVTITDFNGCMLTLSSNIAQPAAPLSLTVSVADVLCYGDSTGIVDITPSGGSVPYTYDWSTGSTSEDVTGLVAGIYTVTITDANGCTLLYSGTVNEPAQPLSFVVNNITDVGCYGDLTGSTDITINGGTPPYSYSWSNGATTEDISGLGSGTYTLTVTDAHGCILTDSVSVSQPTAPLSVTDSVSNALCYGDNSGGINISVSGGTNPYAFLWSNGTTNEDLAGVSASTYTVTITDLNGCTITMSATVYQPQAPISVFIVPTGVLCNGDLTGTINLSPSGGTTPYTYLWSNGSTTEDLAGLGAGMYAFTITDANGCSYTDSIAISEPFVLFLNALVTPAGCAGLHNGQINTTTTGGTPGYNYQWSNGATTEDLLGLDVGTYTVTVTDDHGCNTTGSYTITEPLAVSVTATVTDILCNGLNTGSIDISVSGGIPSYTYSWSTGSSLQDQGNLTAGTYTVTVTDANGCSQTLTYQVNQPKVLSSLATVNNLLCHNDASGSIDLSISGGTAPFSYLWNTGSTLEDNNGLAAGSYQVTITDANGCTTQNQFNISEPTALVVSGIVNNADCIANLDGSVILTISGGTPGYSFLWSDGSTSQDLQNVLQGDYDVTISDANGCIINATFHVSDDGKVTAIADGNTTFCEGDSVHLSVAAINGNTYQWYENSNLIPGANSNILTVTQSGNYYVEVINAKCQLTSNVITVTVNPLPVVTTSGNTSICPGQTLASLSATGGGNYLWTPSADLNDPTIANPVANPKAPTWYTVTVTDLNGCVNSDSLLVDMACDSLDVPDAFSPNDDGINDGFIIKDIDKYPGNELSIYNRWGNLVYQARNYRNNWNGRCNAGSVRVGDELPDGTYYYILDLNNGTKPKASFVVLKR